MQRILNGWVNNREAADLRHRHADYDVIVMDAMKFSRGENLGKNVWKVYRFYVCSALNIWYVTLCDNGPFHILPF